MLTATTTDTKKLSEVLNKNQTDAYLKEVQNLFEEIVLLSEDASKKGYNGIYFTPNINIRHFMSLSTEFLDFLSEKLLAEDLKLFVIPTNSSISDDTKIYVTWVGDNQFHKMNLIYCNFKGKIKNKTEKSDSISNLIKDFFSSFKKNW
jgi:hypothetical protein